MEHINNFVRSINTSIDYELELGCNFFLCFARFEYALKKSNYFTVNRGFISPDWLSYANSISNLINKSNPVVSEAINYFMVYPTKKQEVREGIICYTHTPFIDSEDSFVWAIKMIKRVRNNFFHGGKYNDLVVEDSFRNTRLLNYSLVILNECLTNENDVTNYFRL